MIRVIFSILLILGLSISLSAQRQDMTWMFGGSSINVADENGYAYGNTVIDFKQSPPEVYFDDEITLDFGNNNPSICDAEGNILLYSNDMSVHNHLHQPVPGVDTISYSSFWELWSTEDYPEPGDIFLSGFTIVQNTIILPHPSIPHTYTLVYQIRDVIDNSYSRVRGLYYSTIQREGMSGGYIVLQKDKEIIQRNLKSGQVTACRHANGRDWWLIQHSYEHDEQLIFLFDPQGIHLSQTIALTAANPSGSSTSQCYFSPDGKYYGVSYTVGNAEDTRVNLYAFDRCSGQSDFLWADTLENYRITAPLSFSPSGQYMYKSTHRKMYQYDLWSDEPKASKVVIGEYDGYVFQYHEWDPGRPTELGLMALAPNGKIYSAPSGSNRYLHSIEYPDEKGTDAQLVQRKIMLSTSNHVGVPNHPEYRLGPIDGSSCDSLGIDNHPIARFRYEQDTLDFLNVRFTDLSYFRPESWTWDFGDGHTFDGERPHYHQYESPGVYEVCLRVNNENSEHEECQTLYIGVTSSTEVESIVDITLSPNPAVEMCIVQVNDYMPQSASIEIYTATGNKIKSTRIYQGSNMIDLSELASGVYIYRIVDKETLLKVDRLVKM